MIRTSLLGPLDTPADPSYVGHMPTEHLSTAQVAAQLGVDVRTIHRMVAAGRLEPVYKGTCDGVICDVESGDSLGLLVRTALDHLAVCTDVCTCTDPAVACPACLRKRDRQGWPKDWQSRMVGR